MDYTIFFRLLSDYDPPFDGAGATGFDFVRDAFYEVPFGDTEQVEILPRSNTRLGVCAVQAKNLE